MGFLGVTRHKRKRKDVEPQVAKKKAVAVPLNIQDLPAEILQTLLVYSGNLELPQSSPILAHKLKRRKALEKYMLSEQVHNRTMHIAAAAWPFVTARMLAKLDVQAFDSKYIPHALETKGNDRAVGVIMYMVSKGCLAEDPADLYVKVLRRGLLGDAMVLCDKQFPCDHRAVILAMDLGDQDLAARLISLDKSDDSAEEVWAHATRVNNQPVLDFLGTALLK